MKKKLKLLIQSPMDKIARLCLLVWIAGHYCIAAESFDDKRPNEHFCPITLQVMADPVIAADGHSYERKAISEHFNTGNPPKSPITGLPLKNRDLFDNQPLKAMIREWKPGKQNKPYSIKDGIEDLCPGLCFGNPDDEGTAPGCCYPLNCLLM